MATTRSSTPFTSTSTLVVVLLLLCRCPISKSQEVEDEGDFSYKLGSKTGPERWGDLRPEWAACKNGTMQSPIDLTAGKSVQASSSLGRLVRHYKPDGANATLRNRGHGIALEWAGDAGSILVNGTEYFLKHCQWHSPSEHSVNGKKFQLEMQMVHVSSDKKVAVVAVLYKQGRPDTFLSQLDRDLKDMSEKKHHEREVGVVNPRHIKLGSRRYYRYQGSLTSPPCTEGVVWTIINKVRSVSRQQIRQLRLAVRDGSEENARPTQSSTGRMLQLYSP